MGAVTASPSQLALTKAPFLEPFTELWYHIPYETNDQII